MNKSQFPSVHPQVASTLAADQLVIVLADSGQVTILNELGTHIWQICDGKHNIGQIVQDIVDEYEVDQPTAEQDVLEFLDQMVGLQALLISDTP